MQPSRSVMMDKERVVFMTVLVVLFASLLLFGGLGTLGVDALSTWQDFVGWALAEMFLFMASAHFARTKEDLINIVPKASPNPRILVRLIGVLEVLGVVGLVIAATRGLAGLLDLSQTI